VTYKSIAGGTQVWSTADYIVVGEARSDGPAAELSLLAQVRAVAKTSEAVQSIRPRADRRSKRIDSTVEIDAIAGCLNLPRT
jgi:hypothetical protein